jgi:folate-dependent phosphoribosylglycinamide formyltransferase PurN
LLRIGWFSTGRDVAALKLFTEANNAIKTGYLDAEISYVFSNREPGEFFESDRFFNSVIDCGIPLINFSYRKFKPEMRKSGIEESSRLGVESSTLKKWRELFDRNLEKLIKDYETDLKLLAGYMLIFSEYFVKRHTMLNLHPAPPGGPKGTWQEVVWEIIQRRLDLGGCMMHIVTEKLDEGPTATYCTFPVKGTHFDKLWFELAEKLKVKSFEELRFSEGDNNLLFKSIREEEFKREIPLIIETLKSSSEGRIKIRESKVMIGGKRSEKGLCLNREIEKYLRVKK